MNYVLTKQSRLGYTMLQSTRTPNSQTLTQGRTKALDGDNILDFFHYLSTKNKQNNLDRHQKAVGRISIQLNNTRLDLDENSCLSARNVTHTEEINKSVSSKPGSVSTLPPEASQTANSIDLLPSAFLF